MDKVGRPGFPGDEEEDDGEDGIPPGLDCDGVCGMPLCPGCDGEDGMPDGLDCDGIDGELLGLL